MLRQWSGSVAGLVCAWSVWSACVAGAQPIDVCGEIVRGTECLLVEVDGTTRYVLDDLAGFDVGDRVRVIGELEPGCVSICQEGAGCIRAGRITYCDGDRITACGVLVQGVECVLFQDDRDPLVVLDDLGDFAVGDRVQVSGVFAADCLSICQQGDGCLTDNTITAAAPGACEGGSVGCGSISLALLSLGLAGLLCGRGRGPGASGVRRG